MFRIKLIISICFKSYGLTNKKPGMILMRSFKNNPLGPGNPDNTTSILTVHVNRHWWENIKLKQGTLRFLHGNDKITSKCWSLQ